MALRRLLTRTSRTASASTAATTRSNSTSTNASSNNMLRLGSGGLASSPSPSASGASTTLSSAAAAAAASNATSSGAEQHMTVMRSWLLYILVPTAVVTWKFTRQYATTAMATIFVPCLAISQGAWGILRYRLHFGDAPLPKTPSHGVVQVVTNETDTEQKATEESSAETITTQQGAVAVPVATSAAQPAASSLPPLRILVIGDSLAIGVGQGRRSTPVMPEVIAKTLSRQLDGRIVYWTCHGRVGASTGWILRELERGVSYLQDEKQQEEEEDDDDYDDEEDDLESLPDHFSSNEQRPPQSSSSSCSETDSSEMSSSSSSDDEDDLSSVGMKRISSTNSNASSLDQQPSFKEADDDKLQQPAAVTTSSSKKKLKTKKSLKVWRQRLAQHGERFDQTSTSEFLSQYDIAIVLTGSNDLKSAFFPFLLSGEDAEFRRQAVERANGIHGSGSNNNYFFVELRLLFEKLNRKMQIRVENWRESLLSGTDAVASRVEETIERIAPETGRRISQLRSELSSSATKREAFARSTSDESRPRSGQLDEISEHDEDHHDYHPHSLHGRQRFPLVVLPGLPARALPIFQTVPLRWLAVPIVDNLDTHKMTLAKSHPGQVLFVPAPTVQQLALYERREGDIYQAKRTEQELFNVRDIKSRDSRRIRSEMQDYYQEKERRMGSGRTNLSKDDSSPFLYNYLHSHPKDKNNKDEDPKVRRRSQASGSGLFSVDQIHPRDQGYDFWGRHIGNAISQEWKKQHL